MTQNHPVLSSRWVSALSHVSPPHQKNVDRVFIPRQTFIIEQKLHGDSIRDGRSISKEPIGWSGIQLSIIISILVHVPTDHRSPLQTNSPSNKILCQVYDADLGHFVVIKSPSGKYFPFKTLAHIELWSVSICQLCLPNVASLNVTKSPKPIPTRDF